MTRNRYTLSYVHAHHPQNPYHHSPLPCGGGGAALIQETLMSFRVFVFLLLLSSAKGMSPEQSDIAMRDRKIAMSEHNAAVEKAPEVTRLFGNVFA